MIRMNFRILTTQTACSINKDHVEMMDISFKRTEAHKTTAVASHRV